jgi:hypothetical protein
MSLKGLGVGVEQGPKGGGHTFESCRVRQKSLCWACRDCGGSGSAEDIEVCRAEGHRGAG